MFLPGPSAGASESMTLPLALAGTDDGQVRGFFTQKPNFNRNSEIERNISSKKQPIEGTTIGSCSIGRTLLIRLSSKYYNIFFRSSDRVGILRIPGLVFGWGA